MTGLLNAFTTGNPLLGGELLEFSIRRDLGVLLIKGVGVNPTSSERHSYSATLLGFYTWGIRSRA